MDFELIDRRVFVRTKCRMADEQEWGMYLFFTSGTPPPTHTHTHTHTPTGMWRQMYPSLFDLRPHTPHAKTAVPPVSPNNEWDDFETNVVRTLKDFYTGRMKHGFTIPAEEKQEMMVFLNEVCVCVCVCVCARAHVCTCEP